LPPATIPSASARGRPQLGATISLHFFHTSGGGGGGIHDNNSHSRRTPAVFRGFPPDGGSSRNKNGRQFPRKFSIAARKHGGSFTETAGAFQKYCDRRRKRRASSQQRRRRLVHFKKPRQASPMLGPRQKEEGWDVHPEKTWWSYQTALKWLAILSRALECGQGGGPPDETCGLRSSDEFRRPIIKTTPGLARGAIKATRQRFRIYRLAKVPTRLKGEPCGSSRRKQRRRRSIIGECGTLAL